MYVSLLTLAITKQVWFSNRRAKWRRHHRSSIFRPYEMGTNNGNNGSTHQLSKSPTPSDDATGLSGRVIRTN